jgi:hypothetical protein
MIEVIEFSCPDGSMRQGEKVLRHMFEQNHHKHRQQAQELSNLRQE